jgi:hypothetical protein
MPLFVNLRLPLTPEDLLHLNRRGAEAQRKRREKANASDSDGVGEIGSIGGVPHFPEVRDPG